MNKGRKLAIVSQPKLIERICEQLRLGCSVRTACEATGLSQSTFFDYLRRGDLEAADHDPRFLEFSESVGQARGEAKARLIGIVNAAATHDWRAAIALLKILSPAEYARTAPPSADIAVKVDTDVIAELLRQEVNAIEPDSEKIARLKQTLEEVRSANTEALGLFAYWENDDFTEVYFKPFS